MNFRNSLLARILRASSFPALALMCNVIYVIGIVPDAIYHFSGTEVAETPLTWEHLIMISSFALSAGLIALKGLVDEDRDALKRYNIMIVSSFATILMFGFDFVGHLLFGVEVSIDAIFSFTHIFLVICISLNFFGAAIAEWRNPKSTRLSYFTLISVSIGLWFFCSVFLNLFNPFTHPANFIATVDYASAIAGNEPILFSYSAAMLYTFFTLTVIFRLLWRWQIPPLTFTILLTIASTAGLFFGHPEAIAIAAISGIAIDALVWLLRQRYSIRPIAISLLLPLVTFSAILLLAPENNWSFWGQTGYIALPTLVGLFLGIAETGNQQRSGPITSLE